MLQLKEEADFNLFSVNKYVSYRLFFANTKYENYFQFFNGMFLYIKLFKYLTFNKKISFLLDMLVEAAPEMTYFLVCGVIISMACSFSGYILFMSDCYSFRSITQSTLSSFKYWVTEMDLEMLMASNRSLGLVFYLFWTLLLLLIIANVFVAILCEAYVSVKSSYIDEENEVKRGERKAPKPLSELLSDEVGKICSWTPEEDARADASNKKSKALSKLVSDYNKNFMNELDFFNDIHDEVQTQLSISAMTPLKGMEDDGMFDLDTTQKIQSFDNAPIQVRDDLAPSRTGSPEGDQKYDNYDTGKTSYGTAVPTSIQSSARTSAQSSPGTGGRAQAPARMSLKSSSSPQSAGGHSVVMTMDNTAPATMPRLPSTFPD